MCITLFGIAINPFMLFIVGLLVALGIYKGIVWYCKKHNITME